eukprot:TRINITY_DN2801_c0_g1_i1.p1 TRINITY_DN2801_c0_g1~~TRINITY_DN2801_c0_g1_i1.p1  ORF type:complete len:162 (-),score=10.34 TRINITY_DN2801_c0_g1_i1:211-696(-)
MHTLCVAQAGPTVKMLSAMQSYNFSSFSVSNYSVRAIPIRIGNCNSPAKGTKKFRVNFKASIENGSAMATASQKSANRRLCLRCNESYLPEENGPRACSFHGHMNGDKGLFALAPPHQGIDGEWTDASGVIVYKWNEKDERPNTGRKNWKKRWSCCGKLAD